MDATPCDHMIEAPQPYCYLGKIMPLGCTACCYYMPDAIHEVGRVLAWERARAGEATRSTQAQTLAGKRGDSE